MYLEMIPVANKLMTFQSHILLFIHDYNFLFSSFFAILFLQILKNQLKVLAAEIKYKLHEIAHQAIKYMGQIDKI